MCEFASALPRLRRAVKRISPAKGAAERALAYAMRRMTSSIFGGSPPVTSVRRAFISGMDTDKDVAAELFYLEG
jgi:hypothetical protein